MESRSRGTMNRETMQEITAYLRAIQELPGDTPSKKHKSFMKLVNEQQANGDVKQVPAPLESLLNVEIAVRKKQHDIIILALKSEDTMIVNRVCKATWFFDGSHKNVIDVFCFRRLFQHVCLNTRDKIVKLLALRLSNSKDTVFAMELFQMVESYYGVQQAFPLLLACDKEFIMSTITHGNLKLPLHIAMKLLNKQPDIIIRFLREQTFNQDYTSKYRHINADTYTYLLPKILKRDPKAFVELYEKHKIYLGSLNTTCINTLIRECREQIIKSPCVYINLIPRAKISNGMMERMLMNLLPVNVMEFRVDEILTVMSHYPREKTYKLLSEAFRTKYNSDIISYPKNITPRLLMLMPDEERIDQARKQLAAYGDCFDCTKAYSCSYYWICYIPVDEAMVILKRKIDSATQCDERIFCIQKMILNNIVNKDSEALTSTLTYFLKRHQNEQYLVFEQVMNFFERMYTNMPNLNEKHISLVYDIAYSFCMRYNKILDSVVEVVLHFYLAHNMMDKVVRVMDMQLDINDNEGHTINFYLFQNHPQYQRKLLEAYAKRIQERYVANKWQRLEGENEDEEECDSSKRLNVRLTICRFITAMYKFNDQHKQLISQKKMKRLTINDYVFLRNALIVIISYKDYIYHENNQFYVPEEIKRELGLCDNEINVKTKHLLSLLKRNPQAILDKWKYYLRECKKNYDNVNVRRFLKNIRWYQDIPIKFAESCINNLANNVEMNLKEAKPNLMILTFLLQGEHLIKFMEPFLPYFENISEVNYKITQELLWCVKFSNPPMPLEFLFKFCEKNIHTTLTPLINLVRRSSLSKVITFARNLVKMQVSMRKHGLRVMNLVVSKHDFSEYIKYMWSIEKNRSMRELLFDMNRDYFLNEPNEATWLTFSSIMLSLRPDDEYIFSKIKLYPSISPNYITKYLQVWFDMIKNLQKMGLEQNKVNNSITKYLRCYTESVYKFLSEKLAEDIIREFLFSKNAAIAHATKTLTILYLLKCDDDNTKMHMEVFGKIFTDIVETQWNTKQIERCNFYPIGNIVYEFIKDFVFEYFKIQNYQRPHVINDISEIYTSVLSPTMNACAYLLLIYAKMLDNMDNMENFGLKLGQYMPELVDIFTERFVSNMSKLLIFFVETLFSQIESKYIIDTKKMAVVKGLNNANNFNSQLMAAEMIMTVNPEGQEANYSELIIELQKSKDPAVQSIMNVIRFRSHFIFNAINF